MRTAGVIVAVGAFLGTVNVTDTAMATYKKLKDTGNLSESEKLDLIAAVGNSGAPGSGAVAAKLLDIFE